MQLNYRPNGYRRGTDRPRGRWRLLHALFPPYRPAGVLIVLALGLWLAGTGWPPPITGPGAYQAEPGAMAVLATPRDVRFGLNQAWEVPDAADIAGAGWSRLVFWWSAFQPRGPRDFNLFATGQDAYIDDELRRGRELAGVILNTPGWASRSGSPNAVPDNLYLPWDHRDNYWGQFVRRLAAHYRGRIDTWIIWNEVDIREGQWRTWDGSVADYVQLQRVAYHAIKEGNPDARVALFGSAWWHDKGAYLSQVLEALAADPDAAAFDHYFDIANLHMYSRASDIAEVVPWYRAQLAARGMGEKAFWVGETNAIPYDDPVWPEGKSGFRASMDEQASYLIEAYAMYLALGVERIGVNRAVDGADFRAGGEPFGLLRNDGSTRPAYAAFQVITRYFSSVQSARYLPTEPSGLTRVVLERPGERVTVLWTTRPRPLGVAVEATTPVALRVTKYGEVETLAAEAGHYTFELEPATANSNELDPQDFVVGGNPVILVEPYDGDLAAANRPLVVSPPPPKRV